MKNSRMLVPILGIIVLLLLFLSLPETPNVFDCKVCFSKDPYLPLIGSGYFSLLVSVSLLFPAFPGKPIARGGFIWSVLLTGALTYMNFPGLCVTCLIGHLCHILIWTIWMVSPIKQTKEHKATLREKLCLVLFAPIGVVALFGSLNLTFRAYGFKVPSKIISSGLEKGDEIPFFSASTIKGAPISSRTTQGLRKIVINFVSPGCSYCTDQLLVVNEVASQLQKGPYRFINVASVLRDDLIESSFSTEWVEDKNSKLQHLFKVTGYPTMFIIGADGKINQVIQGASDELKKTLLASLE